MNKIQEESIIKTIEIKKFIFFFKRIFAIRRPSKRDEEFPWRYKSKNESNNALWR